MVFSIPLNFLFLVALLLFLSACVSSASSLISPFPENTSSGASIAASETAKGAIYTHKKKNPIYYINKFKCRRKVKMLYYTSSIARAGTFV